MTQKVQQALPNLPVIDDPGSIAAFLNRELTPVVRELRARFNEAFGPVVSTTDTQTIGPQYQVWLVDASGGAVTLTLPAAATWPMKLYFKKTDNSGNAVTVACAGSDTVDGSTSLSLAAQYDYAVLWSDGDSGWWRFDG